MVQLSNATCSPQTFLGYCAEKLGVTWVGATRLRPWVVRVKMPRLVGWIPVKIIGSWIGNACGESHVAQISGCLTPPRRSRMDTKRTAFFLEVRTHPLKPGFGILNYYVHDRKNHHFFGCWKKLFHSCHICIYIYIYVSIFKLSHRCP